MAKFLKKKKKPIKTDSRRNSSENLNKSTRDWIRNQKPQNKSKAQEKMASVMNFTWLKNLTPILKLFWESGRCQLVHRSKEPICRNYACKPILIPLPPLSGTQNQVLFIFSETNAKQIHLLFVEPTFPPPENRSTVYLSPAFENFPHSLQCSKKNKGFCLLISSVNSLHTLGQNPSVLGCFTMSMKNHILTYNLHWSETSVPLGQL